MAHPHPSWLAAALLALATCAFAGPAAPLAPPTPADLSLAPAKEKLATAHAHFVTARMLEEAGKPREALGHYLKFLAAGGDAGSDLTAHVADLMVAYQDIDSALKLLEARLTATPASPQAWISLTQFSLKHAGEREELANRASGAAAEMLHKFPTNAASWENAVRTSLALGHRDDAGNLLDDAMKQRIRAPSFWLRLGRVAQEVWPIADGEKRAAHLQKINPFFEKARDLALGAKNEAAAVEAADYFLFSNQLPLAAEICEKVVSQSGGLEGRKRLVRLYEAMEKPAESLHALEELVKAFPNDVEHRRLLASQYLQKRDVAGATAQLEAALQAGGGELQDYLYLCELLRFNKDPERFLRFTQRAAQLYPREPRVTKYGALARSRTKQYPEAVKLFELAEKQAESRAPELLDDMFHFNHGVALERSGRFEEAAREFQKSIQLTPTDDPSRAAGTLNYLGYMWLERGEHLDQAEQFIRKANELEPGNSAYVDSLGWVLFKQGKFEGALKELLRAESLMKEVTAEDAEILDHVAQAYDKQNQRAKAEEYWRRVLDLKPETAGLMERARRELGLAPPPPPPKDEPPAGKKK